MGKATVFLLPVRYCFTMFLEGPGKKHEYPRFGRLLVTATEAGREPGQFCAQGTRQVYIRMAGTDAVQWGSWLRFISSCRLSARSSAHVPGELKCLLLLLMRSLLSCCLCHEAGRGNSGSLGKPEGKRRLGRPSRRWGDRMGR
jgi:hypothetical protein